MFDEKEIAKLTPKELAELTDKSEPRPEKAKAIEPIFKGMTAVLIATGPSVTDEQINYIKEKHAQGRCKVLTLNNVYQKVPFTDMHLSCDFPWWRWYYPRDKALRDLPCPKYTWHPDIAKQFNIDYIQGEVKPGLSADPSIIHINHGSGPMWINMALHLGIEKLILIGHDMRYAPDYKPQQRKPGSTPRHYFNEYPGPLQHWPSVKVGLSKPGVLDGLIDVYKKMVPQVNAAGMDVVNCTPGSALTVFRMSTLENELH